MHIPVLQKKVLEYLGPKPNENFIDATIGGGGHALRILEKNKPGGKVLGIDQDLEQIKNCKLKIENFKNRVILVCDSFVNLKRIVEQQKFSPVNGILFDLGLSSWHLEKSGRGFTFLKDEPLDMRYNFQFQITAGKIINEYPQEEIERILREYGEEKFAKRIARGIIGTRKIKPIKTTFQLVEIIEKAVPKKTKINPATRTFQALRIAVNDELNNLKKALPQAIDILEKGGRVAVISFHSLEDRIVKNFFKKNKEKGLLKLLTEKPIVPQEEEIKINPRCRSAKLRAAVKL